MSRTDLALIVDDCVQRLRAGEEVAACLARYPAHASELTPLLEAAVQLRGLAEVHLPADARAQARATLRRTLAAHRQAAAQPRPWSGWLTGGWIWQGTRGLAAVAICIVLIFGALTATSVAASKPGDLSYPLRAAVERAPALFQWTPAGRAATELRVADRRLADLQTHFATAGRADTTALNALLAGDEAAARVAANLDPAERQKVVSRVMAHAEALAGLSQLAAEPEVADALQAAAGHALTIADRVQSARPDPGSRPPAGPGPSPTLPAATETPAAQAPAATTTPAASPQVFETRPASATPTPSVTPTATPTATGQPTGEPASPTATATSAGERRPTRTATPVWPRPSRTPEPRPRATQTLWPRTGTPGLPSLPTRTPPATWPRPHLTATARPHPATPGLPPQPTSTPRPWPRATITPRPHTITPPVPPIVATLTALPTQAQDGTVRPTWVPPIVATLIARATLTPDHTPVGPGPGLPGPRPRQTETATPPPAVTTQPATATPGQP